MRETWRQIQAWFERRGWAPTVALAYVGLVALFVWTFSQFYLPGKGFSYLITFGAHLEDSRLSKIRKLDYYVEKASDGYDAQYYVQIAMDPSLQNKQLRNAVDSLPYRARRILLPVLAFAFGLGEPGAILQAYAVLNAIAWLLLALVLLHWFPARSWDDFIRWAGVLLSFGLCVSLRNALTDGPSLMLIAGGLYLFEKGRTGWATAVLALSGLAKETNLLGAAAFAPRELRPLRAWMMAALRALLIAAPLALWLAYISLRVGPAADAGARNFALPFVAYVHKWREIFDTLPDTTAEMAGPLWSLLMMVALTVQFLFLALRPRWQEAWWRVGSSFALLMVFLGDAVWEGYPGAASRVLLPMQLAFNILVPRGRGWVAVLILGNLTLLGAPSVLRSPQSDGVVFGGVGRLLENSAGATFHAKFDQSWHQTERGSSGYWTWTPGSAKVVITNPHSAPVAVRLRLAITSTAPRQVRLSVNGQPAWQTSVSSREQISAVLADVVLRAGDNEFAFTTDAPAVVIPGDPRELAFALHNFRVEVQQLLPPDAR
jgi:hypothetical protein